MKIGIDARFLSHPQRGGFKTYTNNLLRAISEIDNTNQYFVYLDRPMVDSVILQKENWHYKIINGSFPLFGMPLREQILLRKQVADDQIDVVHFLCNTATVNLNKKYIVTLHDTIQVDRKNKFILNRSLDAYKQWAIASYSKWAINNSLRSADKIITVSDYEKIQISTHFNILSNRISAIHLAPNPIFKPATSSDKKKWKSEFSVKYGIRNRFILGVGYEPRKNIELLIESFTKITTEFEDLNLVIVCAEEGRRAHFKKLVTALNLDGKVVLLASLSPQDLSTLYNLADAFIYPSERESFGLPPLEAMACGVPTVAMCMTSIPEVLGKGALLLESTNALEWANAIKRILYENDFRSQLIDFGLKQASTFSWKKCAQETIQVYLKVSQG